MNDFTPTHPYADLFPLHNEGAIFDEFVADLKKNGLQEKIVMYQGKVLDGRRRERGCRRAGIVPRYTQFNGTEEEALILVVSKNLHRRHLGEGERALIAGKLTNSRRGNQTSESVTVRQAAETVGVTEAAAERAKAVVTKGTPELQQAVSDGTVTLSDAASIVSEPPAVQQQAVEDVKVGSATTASQAVKAKKPGTPRFDEKKFEKVYGPLVRLVDQRGNAMGKGPRYQRCVDLLGEFIAAYSSWKSETA